MSTLLCACQRSRESLSNAEQVTATEKSLCSWAFDAFSCIVRDSPSVPRAVYTVDEIIRLQLRGLNDDPEIHQADSTYKRIRFVIAASVKELLNAAMFVYSVDIVDFFEAQASVRELLGCARSREVDETERASRINCRNDSVGVALQHLYDVKAQLMRDSTLERNLMEKMEEVSDIIKQELHLERSQSSREDRLEFYPEMLPAIAGQSPEDVFRLFISIEASLAMFEATEKEEWLKQMDRLKRIFSELAFILAEHESIHDMVDSGIMSFEALKAAGKEMQDHADTYETCQTVLQECTFRVLAMRQDALTAAKRNRIYHIDNATKVTNVTEVEQDQLKSCESDLHAAQRDFWVIEAKRWAIQRNFQPEVYDTCYAQMQWDMGLTLLSMDVMHDFEHKVRKLMTNRSLRDYDTHDSTDIISCTFGGETCCLARFDLTHHSGITSMRKSIFMHKRLAAYSVPKMSAMFVDNGYAYLHWDAGHSWSSHVADVKFKEIAAHGVVMIHYMSRAVYDMHVAEVIHGNISPESWWVNAHGVPKIIGFDYAIVTGALCDHEYKAQPSEFDPPEFQANPSCRTAAGDVFRFGKCLSIIAKSCQDAMSIDLSTQLASLVSAMTESKPENRLTSLQVFERSFMLLGLLRPEFERVYYKMLECDSKLNVLFQQKQGLRDDEAKVEGMMRPVIEQIADVQGLERRIFQKQRALISRRERMVRDDALGPPRYWQDRSLSPTVNIVPIKKTTPLFQIFRHILRSEQSGTLTKGRDITERGEYTFLDLVGVWRVENGPLWNNFAAEKEAMRKTMKERDLTCPQISLREEMKRAQMCLPGADTMQADINEVYLLHGTTGNAVLSIIESGINERFTSVALFGKGSYFAEDAGKTNQYVRGDVKLGTVPGLHKKLFPEGGEYLFPKFPLKAYYVLLCRVAMGYPVRVKCTNMRKRQMENIDFPESPIFSTSDKRELGCIPGLEDPQVLYHSLVAEIAGEVTRFREMVQFHSARVYVEYIICYTRK